MNTMTSSTGMNNQDDLACHRDGCGPIPLAMRRRERRMRGGLSSLLALLLLIAGFQAWQDLRVAKAVYIQAHSNMEKVIGRR